RGDHVDLGFGTGPPVVVGGIMTAVGILVFLLVVLPSGRRLGALLEQTGERVGSLGPARWVVAPVMRTATWAPGLGRVAMARVLAVELAGVGFATVVERKVPADLVYLKGMTLFNAGNMAEARPYFQEAQRMAPLSTTAIHSAFFEGITYIRENKWK